MDHLMVLLLLWSFAARVSPQDVDYDNPTSLSVLYGISDQKWHQAGMTALHNLNPGKIVVSSDGLTKDIIGDLVDKCNADDTLKVKTVIQTSSNKELAFLSSVKACAILRSPVILNINMDHSGSIIASSVSPTGKSDSIDHVEKPSSLEFNYVFKHPEAGLMPDTATYINRLDKEREAKERGATQDNRSFFSKYWMYIVPVALFVLLSGSANADTPTSSNR